MKRETIYVLHEYGSPSHYNSLVELCKKNGINIEFRVFDPLSLLASIYRRRFKLVFKSICFMLALPFIKPKKIILAIAPFYFLLIPLSIILKKHKIYYHTSYTFWDGSFMVHPTRSSYIRKYWHSYISSKVLHIFSVSNKTKEELIKNDFSTPDRISVVNHSFNVPILETPHKKNNSFIFVGRLDKPKGLLELLDIFSRYPHAELTIVGRGELDSTVRKYSQKYNNINYIGYINGLQNIVPIYQRNSFLLLNSHRTHSWEELFGITIIEGMASGCVPLTTDHSGPKEIITNGVDGFITTEGNIEALIIKAIQMSDDEYQNIRASTIAKGYSYHSSQMASRWSEILAQ